MRHALSVHAEEKEGVINELQPYTLYIFILMQYKISDFLCGEAAAAENA